MGTIGIVAENEKYTKGKEAAADLASIGEEEFLALLERYCDPSLSYGPESMDAQPIIGLITPAQFHARGLDPPDWIERPLFSTLAQIGSSDTSSSAATAAAANLTADPILALSSLLPTAASDEAAAALVLDGLLLKLERSLSMSKEEIDTSRPLHAYGVDSLLAVELRNWFAKVWRAEVGVFDITGQGSIAGLAAEVGGRSELRKKEAV